MGIRRVREIKSGLPRLPETTIPELPLRSTVVNPDARKPDSQIAGMPIFDVDRARTVMVCKRSLNPGFAGIQNPLFFNENTVMLFGDAKKMVSGIVGELKGS